MGLEFKTAARQATADLETVTFPHDDTQVTAYKPKGGQYAMLMHYTGRHSRNDEKLAGLIDFFISMFDPESQRYFGDRLLDPLDTFDIEGEGGVNDIMKALAEEWSGKASRKSTASTSSPKSTGTDSEPTTTPSTSLPYQSATS